MLRYNSEQKVMLIRKPKILCGEAAEDNNGEQWELLGGQPLFGGTHRLQSHAENRAIFHAPLQSIVLLVRTRRAATAQVQHMLLLSSPICSKTVYELATRIMELHQQQAEFAILEISNQNSTLKSPKTYEPLLLIFKKAQRQLKHPPV